MMCERTRYTFFFKIAVSALSFIGHSCFLEFPGSYLVEVSADGHVVYKWYHRIFWETARSFFLSDKPFASSLYVEMANYFLGR